MGNIYSDISNIKFNDPSGQGLMPITIVVNEKTTYSLVVHYEPTEYDNSLQSVTINGKEIVLNPGQYNYEYTVESNVNELVVAATIKDNENFKFGAASNAPGTFSIKDMVSFGIVVEPKDTSSGAKSVTYTFDVVKKGMENVPSDKGDTGSGNTNSGNVNNNPNTGGASVYLMGLILIMSLVGSLFLYRKNLEINK